MTENTEHISQVEQLGSAESCPEVVFPAQVKVEVKCEKVDAEVEAKLRALNAKIKLERQRTSRSKSQDNSAADELEDGESDETSEDKKAIVPVKSSNEILAELFGVFNAAPPEELLNDKNLLKKRKKVKKEKKKKDKDREKKKSTKSDGECSESDAPGKHKRKRKKHKHKDIKDKEKHKDREKDRDKERVPTATAALAVPVTVKEKDKKEETRKRSHEEETPPVKRERLDKDRERGHNSFYNGYRESGRSREPNRNKSRAGRDQSDVSLSDEESYLRERASNGRHRPAHNSFYESKPKPSSSSTASRRPRRSRSRSRSRDLGIDKKRLLEIARKNAISMFKRGNMPGVAHLTPEVKDRVLLKMRYGGRTVQDLTDFCKKISTGDDLSDLSSEEDSDVDKNGNAKAFHHPFQLKEREPIVMHIRNSTALVPAPTKRDEQTKAITMQFPVSSGQVHRMNEVWVPVERKDTLAPLPSLPPAKQATNMFKDVQMNVFAKAIPHQEQQEPAFKAVGEAPPTIVTNGSPVPEPVTALAPLPSAAGSAASFVPEVPIPSTAPPAKPPASIFPDSTPPSMDVSSIITQRLSAIRRLQDNPTDSEALKMMYNAQKDMSSWANSKHLPGQFTGSTGAQVMKVHELNSGPQLWARKDQMTATKPVTGGMGMALLQKMGWKPGEGLGRAKTGSLQPLLLDIKLDKRGLVSREDIKQQPPRPSAVQRKNRNHNQTGVGGGGVVGPGVAAALNAQDKHPVCVLNELTSKNKWTPPQYKLQQETGLAHSRMFLFSVEINGQTYTPPHACINKKEAKLNAAKICLRALGILPPS